MYPAFSTDLVRILSTKFGETLTGIWHKGYKQVRPQFMPFHVSVSPYGPLKNSNSIHVYNDPTEVPPGNDEVPDCVVIFRRIDRSIQRKYVGSQLSNKGLIPITSYQLLLNSPKLRKYSVVHDELSSPRSCHPRLPKVKPNFACPGFDSSWGWRSPRSCLQCISVPGCPGECLGFRSMYVATTHTLPVRVVFKAVDFLDYFRL